MDIEKRVFAIELREADAQPDSANDAPRIQGYAAVFNSKSEEMWGFREVMEPGFFDDVLEDDVRALFNHDRNFVLGRSSAGTLGMSQDAKGLLVDIDPPQTQLIRDLVIEPMKRGDINQMSFAFSLKPGGDDWREEDGQLVRVLKKGGALRLYDVSVVTEPAYPETSAGVRSRVDEYRQQNDARQEPVLGVDTQERTRNLRRRFDLVDSL